MIGTWRWNIGFGVVGGFLSLLFSLNGNTLAVSCIRGLYAFAAFFLLGYLFRAVLKMALAEPGRHAHGLDVRTSDSDSGRSFEAVTPDETEELHGLLRGAPGSHTTASIEGEPSAFQPLKPPKLVSTQNKEPEELAKAIRHLTGG